MESAKPGILYHYCTIDTFLKIMQSSTIWLSDIRKSNDSMEMKWVYERCWQLLSSKLITLAEELASKSNNPALSQQIVHIYSDVERVFYSKLNTITNFSWVFCLSQLEDTLSQWRGYSDDGNGISIGFSCDYLECFNQSTSSANTNLSYGFCPIEYFIDDNEVMKLLMIDHINSDLNPDLVRFYSIQALNKALQLKPIYKCSSFSEEKEWRMFICYSSKDREQFNIPTILKPIQTDACYFQLLDSTGFYKRNNKIVSYVPLRITDMSKALCEIWIGPKADVSKADIYNVLVQYGHIHNLSLPEIVVNKSDASYQ